MSWIDFILNVAGVLLWFNWCSVRTDVTGRALPSTLAGTLRPAGRDRFRSWRLLGGLAALVLGKALIYWQLNSAAEWPPRLDLGLVIVAFRVGTFPLALLFSVASLLRLLLIVYTWLLALLVIGRFAPEPDPVQRIIAHHFGALARWPWWLLVWLPAATSIFLWVGLHPLLLRAEAVSPAGSIGVLAAQGALLGGTLILTLKYLLPAILLLYLVSSYVYLGGHPAWDYINHISRVLLRPLRGLPLRSAKMDFAPLAGMVLVLFLLHSVPRFVQAGATRWGMPLWPQ